MSMEYDKMFSGNIRDNFRNKAVAHSIRILREHGLSDEDIKEEMMRDFSVKEEVLDGMLKV